MLVFLAAEGAKILEELKDFKIRLNVLDKILDCVKGVIRVIVILLCVDCVVNLVYFLLCMTMRLIKKQKPGEYLMSHGQRHQRVLDLGNGYKLTGLTGYVFNLLSGRKF